MATNTAFANQVLTLTNAFRAQNGLKPLKLNSELNAAAQTHSQNMALQDFFSHTGKDGSQPWDRAKTVGYQAQAMGENIAAGYTTPQSVVQGWENSPDHRANLLNPSYTELGVGYYYLPNDTGAVNYNYYWTQDFGSGDLNPSTKVKAQAKKKSKSPLAASKTIRSASLDAGLADTNSDIARGSKQDDLLFGGAGSDRLRGTTGSDQLTGGAGQDWFEFGSGRPFNAHHLGVDTIADFMTGRDKIALSKATFGKKVNVAIVSNDAAADRSTRSIVYSLGTGNLFFNANGSAPGFGAGGQFATVRSDGLPAALTRTDFRVVR